MQTINSKYAKAFSRIEGLIGLRSDTILVEVLPRQEVRTAGGIIVGKADMFRATSEDRRRNLALVLLTGVDVKEVRPGQLIMLPFNPLYLSEFPGLEDHTADTLAMLPESDVILKYDSVDVYLKTKELLNQKDS